MEDEETFHEFNENNKNGKLLNKKRELKDK